MMISHRFELNQQALKTFEFACGEDVDLEQAHYHADQYGNRSRIVVASVQTLNSSRKGRRRIEKFDPDDFGLIMVDEAHRSAAASYRRVFEYFADAYKIGVTATPDRLDGVGLGCVFQKVVCDYNIAWGIQNGWLVEPKQKFVQIEGLDLSQVRTIGGDLDEKQLAKIVQIEENLHAMAKPIVDLAGADKQTIVFTASVNQAHRLAELIRDYSQRSRGHLPADIAVSLDGSLSPQDPRRQQIVSDFKSGKIQFLVNCGVATEGFDAPNVKLIAVGRPTKSRALYTQMVGRGTRPLPGITDGLHTPAERIAAITASEKPHCTVLDFCGQAGRHKLICTTDILGGSEPPEVVDKAREVSGRGDFDGTTLDAIRQAREELAAEREARRHKVTFGVEYKIRDAETHYDLTSMPITWATRNASGVSDKQRSMLLRLGFTDGQIQKLNRRTASQAIDYAIKNPTTPFGKWIHRKKQQEG